MNISIIENDIVINVIVCNSIEIAKELTGATEAIDADKNQAYMGYKRVNNTWYPPAP